MTASCSAPVDIRRAVIDLGSNTAKLAIADVTPDGVRFLVHDSEACRLGEGVTRTGFLSAAAMDRTRAVVAKYVESARLQGVDCVEVYATSAARSASNGRAFLDQLAAELGCRCELLSGEREAELIFAGVCTEPALQDRDLVAVDLGGGSMEFITGRGGRVEQRTSRDVGCVRLAERFTPVLPVTDSDRAALTAHLAATLADVFSSFQASGREVVATGGTVYTLARLADPAFWDRANRGEAERLTVDTFRHITNDVCGRTLDALRADPAIPTKRADILPAGALTLLTVFEHLGAPEIFVSTRGLRYGLLTTGART